MFKKMKNSTMYSILLLVALLVFCCIFGSRNKLYTEGLTGSTTSGLKDNIYHSGAPHDLPTPLDRKETPQGLKCNVTNETPHASGEADSFEACKSLFKKYYPTNIKTGVMSYFDLQENEKGKDYHNCGVSNISNCKLVSSSWHSPTLGRNVTARGYTLPNTIIKQPPAPPPPAPPPVRAPPPPAVYPTCKPYQGTVWAFCGDKPTHRWGIGPEGQEKAIGNCNYAATNEKRWGPCNA